MVNATGPSVVAIGGGHGLAVTLRAARRYARTLHAVVTVADNGGSTGHLRRNGYDVVPGDIRKCLAALAPDDSALARALERRLVLSENDPTPHAAGNVLIAALVAECGSMGAAADVLAEALGAEGRVIPVADEPLTLVAHTAEGSVEGQVEVANRPDIVTVAVRPADARAASPAVAAVESADQVVLGPGSLFTSVLATACVEPIAATLSATAAPKVFVANLRPQEHETVGYTVHDQVAALRRHGIAPDVVVTHGSTPSHDAEYGVDGVRWVAAPIAAPNGAVHDPIALATVLESLVLR